MPGVLALDGVIRDYAWGSPTAIPQLLGLDPDGRPAAELWFGDHPGDPSVVPALGTTLDAVIAADPNAALGRDAIERFGPRLPFLLKVLAAEQALSIQVHPDLEQARAGFAAEDAAGIPHDAPERNYRDPNHKPELICALTPFDALCGFRPVVRTLDLLDALDIAELGFLAELLRGPDALRAAFTALLTHADPGRLVSALTARLDAKDARLAGVRMAAVSFPGDVGIVLALLLNHVRLRPGEAIFLGAGNVHAYLRGTGVEIMASSDNVLRCGLTPKHIDVAELLTITDFTELADPRCPVDTDDFVTRFLTPVADFALQVIDLDAYKGSCAVGPPMPYLVLSVDRPIRVQDRLGVVDVAPGHAAFVSAASHGFQMSGAGRIFVASRGE
jgi:mannose-6-phosphate isomerase